MEASNARYQHRGLVHGPDQASHGHVVGLLGLQVEVGVPGDEKGTGVEWGAGQTAPSPAPSHERAFLKFFILFPSSLPFQPPFSLSPPIFRYRLCPPLHTPPSFQSCTCCLLPPPVSASYHVGSWLPSPLNHIFPLRPAGVSCSPLVSPGAGLAQRNTSACCGRKGCFKSAFGLQRDAWNLPQGGQSLQGAQWAFLALPTPPQGPLSGKCGLASTYITRAF